MSSTGFKRTKGGSALKSRANGSSKPDNSSVVHQEKTEKPPKPIQKSSKFTWESILAPILFTGLAAFVRMYKIGINNHVVWDEAHFGKFGSYYLRHEFYHDVHPPLGKMLVGLSGYLAGYSGFWDFPSGQEYPEGLDYVKMRIFNAVFSVGCVPFAYYTAKAIGFSTPAVWLLTSLVCFENTYATLGRFILLDSMLLFFTVTSFFSFVMFHNQRSRPFSRKWWKWLGLTGISLGCTISVKMVGLFIIILVGIYTVIQLWNFLGDKEMSWKTYVGHWLARIVCLIIFPILVFMLCFRIHFLLLYNSGPGDANMPSLFQAGLNGTDVGGGPRNVAVGSSVVSIKNQALGGTLLHSHIQKYPVGSQQQQVTTYGYKDGNNMWYFDFSTGFTPYDRSDNSDNVRLEFVRGDGIYRLVHNSTNAELHAHQIEAPIQKNALEVSGAPFNGYDDFSDDWIIEFVDQRGTEDKDILHPLTTFFRIKNSALGCYLAQTGNKLPQWGFRQGEVACVMNPFKRDKRTWWNVESHVNPRLPDKPEDFKFPKTPFIKDFIFLNLAMIATNNALIPDSEKFDRLASRAWEWPTLHKGLRLCGWGDHQIKYYLLGTPTSTWLSTLAVLTMIVTTGVLFLRWVRQQENFGSSESLNEYLMGAFYPLLAWGLHFVPFAMMSRVTYVHHYLPALYFALIVLTYVFDMLLRQSVLEAKFGVAGKYLKWGLFVLYFCANIACFFYFSPISFGMTLPSKDYSYLNWVDTWTISNPERQ